MVEQKLICQECNQEYTLSGEDNPEEFECECGGTLKLIKNTGTDKKKVKQLILALIVLGLVITITSLIMSQTGSTISDNPSEDEYRTYMAGQLYMQVRLNEESIEDLENYRLGRISREKLVNNKEGRKVQLESILLDMKRINPPPGYGEAHNYNVKALEYKIMSEESFIKYHSFGSQEDGDKGLEYLNISREYSRKADKVLPPKN